jgi:energy-coupling factor transport system ATP-binding protein
MDTEVLILDEPTSELDVKATERIISILRALKDAGKTVIVVDHSLEGYRGIADKVYELKDGVIARSGTFEALYPESQGTLNALYDEPGLTAYIPDRERKPLISILDLWKQYDKVQALCGVNLDIYEGEFIALLGENGSGKTTLVKHFNGLLRPDRGTIHIGTCDATTAPIIELVRKAGLVFQNPDTMLFADTVREEILFGLTNIGSAEPDTIISRVLNLVGLSGEEETYPRHLSRGERQRLAVACILAMEPGIIILDEPTTGLDEKESDQVMSLMKTLQANGHTIIMVTHNMRIAEEYADRIIAMGDGRITGDFRINGEQAA